MSVWRKWRRIGKRTVDLDVFYRRRAGKLFVGDMLSRAGQTTAAQFLQVLIPTPLTVEGGVFFRPIRSSFLLFSPFQKKMAVMYLIFSLDCAYLLPSPGMRWGCLPGILFFGAQYQWMMVFALPLLWTYNGKKGKHSWKYLFYFFLPAAYLDFICRQRPAVLIKQKWGGFLLSGIRPHFYAGNP